MVDLTDIFLLLPTLPLPFRNENPQVALKNVVIFRPYTAQRAYFLGQIIHVQLLIGLGLSQAPFVMILHTTSLYSVTAANYKLIYGLQFSTLQKKLNKTFSAPIFHLSFSLPGNFPPKIINTSRTINATLHEIVQLNVTAEDKDMISFRVIKKPAGANATQVGNVLHFTWPVTSSQKVG